MCQEKAMSHSLQQQHVRKCTSILHCISVSVIKLVRTGDELMNYIGENKSSDRISPSIDLVTPALIQRSLKQSRCWLCLVPTSSPCDSKKVILLRKLTENTASTTEGNFKMLFRALATSIFINLSWIIFMMQAKYSVYKLRTKLLCYSWWNWQAIQENGFPRSSWHDGFALHWHSRICFY